MPCQTANGNHNTFTDIVFRNNASVTSMVVTSLSVGISLEKLLSLMAGKIYTGISSAVDIHGRTSALETIKI